MGGRKLARSGEKQDNPNGTQQQQPRDNVDSSKELTEHRSFAYMDSLLPSSWRKWWLPIALTFMCYGPNLIIYASDNDTWVYDDHSSVRSNPCVTGRDQLNRPVSLSCVLWADYWGTPMSSNMSHKSYRPVTTLFFIAERFLWGFADSRLWHLGNVATKAVSVWLFAKVAKICLTCPESAHFATLLFTVHPIHTESVSNITGQAESLSAVFMLLAFLAYARRGGSKLINAIAAVLAALAATLSKEAGFSALAIIGVHIVSAELRAVKAGLLKKEQQQLDGQEKSGRYLHWRDLRQVRPATWLNLAVYCVAGVGIFIGRCFVQQERPQFNSFMNPAGFHNSRLARSLTMAYYALTHARLMVAPVTLCPDYSNSAIPELEWLLDQRCLPIYLAAVGLAWSVVALVRAALHKHRDVHELVACLAWLALPFLPVSNLFFVVGFAVAERVLFAPSIGFCLLVGLGVRKLTEVISRVTSDHTRHSLVSNLHRSLRCLLVLLAIRTCIRDVDWNTSRSLWSSAYKACPPNANVLANLAFSEPGNPGFQRFLFERATAVGKPFSMDHSVDALSRLMDHAGQHREMLDLCQQHDQGGSPRMTQCVAFGRLQLQQPAKAVKEFQRLYSRMNDAHWHLAKVQSSDVIRGYARSLALSGRADKAIQLIRLHEADVPDPVKQHLAVSEVLAVALRPRLKNEANSSDAASFESAVNHFKSRSPSPEAFTDLAKDLCLSGRYEEAMTVLDAVQPAQARQAPMAIYLRRFAEDGLYSVTPQCQERENELLRNLSGLSPLATLGALASIAERVADTDLSDAQFALFHVCRLLVQPIDALLSSLDEVAKKRPPFPALVGIRRLFLRGQRGELILHSQMTMDRQKLDMFLNDMRLAVKELADETADAQEDWKTWSMKPTGIFRMSADETG